MTDAQAPIDTETTVPEASLPPESAPPPRRSLARRIGCGLLLVIWFVLLLTPCALFTLATQGQITVRTGALEEQELRIFLQMDAENRGLVVSNGLVQSETATSLCIETTVSYLLWAGREEGTVHCTCYARATADAAWSYDESLMSACAPR